MAQGRLQHDRRMTVSQALLVWASASAENIGRYIQTGFLDVDTSNKPPAAPYNQDALRAIVKQPKEPT